MPPWIFVYLHRVKLKPFKLVPGLIAFGVIALTCLVRCLHMELFDRLERITYDMRARTALRFPAQVATNLGFVAADEASIDYVHSRNGLRFGLYWPRQVYGRMIEELAAEGVKAVALDVVFKDLRSDHPSIRLENGGYVESDDFFATQMRLAGNVIIARSTDVTPPALFLTNALAVGDISTEPDPDGTLRRAQAFVISTNWHQAFRQVAADPDYGIDLQKARVEPGCIVLPREGTNGDVRVPLDADGNIDLADFGGDKLPPGVARKARPFTLERVWHMGIVLAARQLNLDLAKAEVDLAHGQITLRGPGVERVIPVDAEGYFYIDWCLPVGDRRVAMEPVLDLLELNRLRLEGRGSELVNRWKDKLVVIGSAAVGNDLTDHGATPLRKDTLLASKHWNIANSILTGRFVERASLPVELELIVALGIAAALLTWYLRALEASGAVLLLFLAYTAVAFAVYVRTRYWIPLVMPLGGATLMVYVSLVTWRVVFEQAEQRRVKSIFSTVVSPKIMNVLLEAEKLSLGGARREITVFFADVRGFTELTDTRQEQVTDHVRNNKLTGDAAEACFDEQARETLSIVNLYLGVVADTVIKHDGTLDKFIGDCVMAFWGAPTADPKHALACVQAAIDAQRAVYELNQQRATENKKRELENLARLAAGLPALPMLPTLLLGSGINTGMATVGLMGSQAKTWNYTVFGREVNLASRLESASGRGRIYIGETTFEQLRRDDPALAATCTALPPIKVKGISMAVNVYEVPWRPPGAAPFDEELAAKAAADASSFTGFVQRGSS